MSYAERRRDWLKDWHSPTEKTVDQINAMPAEQIPDYLKALAKRERRRARNLAQTKPTK